MMCDSQVPTFHSADLRMVGGLLSDPVTRAIRLEDVGEDARPPAFHSADLCMVGGLLSDPVTRAIRHDALGFQEPAWPEGRPALVVVGEKLSGALTTAIRNDALSFPAPPDWSSGSSDIIRRVFGVDREYHKHHLFCAEPIAWAKFTEPQFTKGFAHFLDVPERNVRIGRTRALLKALGVETAMEIDLGKEMTRIKVTAEAPTSGKKRRKRIDLLIEWEYSSNRNLFTVVIEAKLGHHITHKQLSDYRKHIVKKIPLERRLFIVVSPWATEKDKKALRCNQEWRWKGWRDLLIAHERALCDEYDDPAYSQFRKTLWDQVG